MRNYRGPYNPSPTKGRGTGKAKKRMAWLQSQDGNTIENTQGAELNESPEPIIEIEIEIGITK